MRAAVMGSPIGHSLSPFLHRAAYRAMGLDDWSYEAIECDEARLPEVIGGMGPEWAGLSLTMPLKRAVLPLLDTVAPLAVEVGGANTVIFRDGARHGENTDVYGITQALAEAEVPVPGSALVLGGGATAASALAGLRNLGLGGATLVVRDAARAGETVEVAERLGMALRVETFDKLDGLLDVDLVISTLPGDAGDRYADRLARVPALFDVVYAPWPTRAATAVKQAGGLVVSGFAMLLHQAAKQVELMTGRTEVPVETMRAAGEAELLKRTG